MGPCVYLSEGLENVLDVGMGVRPECVFLEVSHVPCLTKLKVLANMCTCYLCCHPKCKGSGLADIIITHHFIA